MHGLDLIETCLARRCSVLFSTIMFMPAVSVILRKKTVQSIPKLYVFGFLIIIVIVLKILCAVYSIAKAKFY